MKEQDVRQRIESFLKRTAREVVVPASMGLGLALSGCDHTGIQARADAAADTSQSAATDGIVADATRGRESAANSPDVASQPDLRLPDDVRLSPDTGQADLPISVAPYMAIVRLDAGVDASVPDVRPDAGAPDADVPDAGAADTRTPDARPDARQADLPTIFPPYLPPYMPAPRPDAARDVSAVMPPYMMPPPPAYMASPFPPAPPPPDPPPSAPPDPPPLPPPPPPYMAPAFASVDAARDLPAIEPPYLIAPHAAPIAEPPADKSK
jgi:hypothetical protein